MLPFVLVLIAVKCVFAAPQASITAYNINELSPPRDSGSLVNSYLTNGLFELVDGGTSNVYALTSQQVISDFANQPDAYSQALALSQSIAVIGELATGVPGDACASAALVNAAVSGNGIGQALGDYLNVINNNIDVIVALVNNPSSLRFASGPRGNCAGGGRNFPFEALWDGILASANPYQIGLLNEQYCSARRLYSAYNVQSNNIAAAISAASVAPVAKIFSQSVVPVANFLRVAVGGGNPAGAAAEAKNAIARAARS